MSILFLDVDGVLNCSSRWRGPFAEHLDPHCLDNLSRIVRATECQIVISSTWRILPETYRSLIALLQSRGLPVIGKTPVSNTVRGKEIKAWLKNNPGVIKYAVLDDDSDAGYGLPPGVFFQTTLKEGLTVEIADAVISYLQ